MSCGLITKLCSLVSTPCVHCLCINLINLTFGLLLPRLCQMLPNALSANSRSTPSGDTCSPPSCSVASVKKKKKKSPQATSSGDQAQTSSTGADSRRGTAKTKSSTATANPSTSAAPAVRSRCYSQKPVSRFTGREVRRKKVGEDSAKMKFTAFFLLLLLLLKMKDDLDPLYVPPTEGALLHRLIPQVMSMKRLLKRSRMLQRFK